MMKKIDLRKVGLVIRNNYIINRSIPIILFIVVFALGCIIGAMPVSDVESRYEYNIVMNYSTYGNYMSSMTSTYNDLIGSDSVFSMVYIVAALILAFLSALSLNGFMRDRSGNDFYHSLSVNRGEIFLANYVTAFVNSAVTIIFSQLGGLLLMNFIAGYKPMTLGEMILEQLPIIATILLFTALFTALAMIATTASGTVFAGIVNYSCLNFYIPATILAVAVSGNQLFDSNLMDWLEHYPHAYAYTSPFIRYIYSAGNMIKMTAISYVIFAVATLALIALGMWIYSVKKNENASKPLPFTRMIRPLQYLLIFDMILLGTTFFYAITSSNIWGIIGGLLALFFSFIVFNAFADKSFNGVFKRSRHMAFILIMTVVIGAVFVADIFNIYKEPVPDHNNAVSAYINCGVGYEDREEWMSYWFEKEINEDTRGDCTEINEDNKEDLARLWELVSEGANDRERYYSEGVEYLSVSMGIKCENDLSWYHTYAYVYSTYEHFDEIKAILDEFEAKYQITDKNISYYEKTEAEPSAYDVYEIDLGPTVATTEADLSEIAVEEPLDLETSSGVGVEIAFESEDMLVFYGDFGLFGYDLKTNELKFSVDFVKAVGIEGSVQGSYGTAVDVSEDGNTVVISEYTVETGTRGKTCYIDIPSLTYKYGEYEPLDAPFNKENIKGSVYSGVKISHIKYMLDGKEWSLFE